MRLGKGLETQSLVARLAWVLVVPSLLVMGACSTETSGGNGSLSVLLEAETVITGGLQAGDDVENIRDGWSVIFEKYLTAVGDIDIHLATDEQVEAEAEESFVVDMVQLPSAGSSLWQLEGLAAGRWEFNYSTPIATTATMRDESVNVADFDAMVAAGWTYLVQGVMTRTDGQSCPPSALATPGDRTPNGQTSGDNACYDAPSVRFDLGAAAATNFGPCEIDGVPGFAVTANATQTVAATIHGDHLFFNGFPEGDEGGVVRLAQWLADCDLNLDGTVELSELEQIAPSALPELDERYQLGGSPITPLNTMADYLAAQLKTQGHYQGEGECPVDGVAHEHGHNDEDGHDDDHDDH